MQHSFNVELAKIYGVDSAVFLNHIAYWVNFNKNEGINFHEDRYWTYNKIRSFPQHFPYWSHKQIERLINKCVNDGLLLRSSFNKLKYDRTCWYSLSDLASQILNLDISLNRDIQIPESVTPNPEIGTTIPINKPYNKTQIKDKKAQRKKRVDAVSDEIVLPDWLPKELWEEFKQHRKEMKKTMSMLAQKKTIVQLDKMRSSGQDIESVINQSIANGWQGIFELKSKGHSHGKDSKYYSPNGKFDATQYLLDSIRADESKENNRLPEDSLPFKDCEYLQYDGAGGNCY